VHTTVCVGSKDMAACVWVVERAGRQRCVVEPRSLSVPTRNETHCMKIDQTTPRYSHHPTLEQLTRRREH